MPPKLAPEQKLSIAKKLDALGVDAIEAGFPVISDGEFKGVKMIAAEGLSCEIVGLTRTIKKDSHLRAKGIKSSQEIHRSNQFISQR